MRVVIWGGVITLFSGPNFSFQHNLHVVDSMMGRESSVVPRSFPSDTSILVLRKAAHALEYAILAVLLWKALSFRGTRSAPAWSWRRAAAVIVLVGLCASTDELRQSRSQTRHGQSSDVVLDVSGGLAALALLFLTTRLQVDRAAATC